MKLKVIKIGGKLVENEASLNYLCDELSALHPGCVLIHGGGSMAGQLSSRLGITTRMVDGRRITDRATLEVVIMTYAGLTNKKIVAALQSRGVNACGLSGCDMKMLQAHQRTGQEINWGFVGDIDKVNISALTLLLHHKVMPVLSPITYAGNGQLLNTNADSVASAVAIALSREYETELIFCFDKPGLLADAEDETSIIPEINYDQYQIYLKEGKIHSGMLPKLENAFKTRSSGVHTIRLTAPSDLNGGTLLK